MGSEGLGSVREVLTEPFLGTGFQESEVLRSLGSGSRFPTVTLYFESILLHYESVLLFFESMLLYVESIFL